MSNTPYTCPLNTFGVLAITGPDAGTFLQGQLTFDVLKLQHNQTHLGAYANQKGRVIAVFLCTKQNDTFYLMMPNDILASTQDTLMKYARFSKVTLENLSDTHAGLGFSNPIDFSEAIPFAYPDQRLALFAPKKIIETVKAPDTFQHVEETVWHLADIQAGLPFITEATQARYLPQRLNLDTLGAIDFEKGCYLGQEIIARLHYRGKVKHHLHHKTLTTNTPPTPGTPIDLNGHQAEVIASVQTTPTTVETLLILPDD